jgi:hypothetical protein
MQHAGDQKTDLGKFFKIKWQMRYFCPALGRQR